MHRLCTTYISVSKLALYSDSFAHNIDVHWPVCTYELRGDCRDASCAYQMITDYQLDSPKKIKELLALYTR